VSSIVFAILGGFSHWQDRPGSLFLLSAVGIGGLFAFAITTLLVGLFYAAFIRAGLKIADGQPITFGDLFDFTHAGPAFVLALMFAAAGFVVGLVPVLGQLAGIVIAYFGFYAFHALVQQNLAPIDAVKASIALQTRDVGTSILVLVVTWLISFVGFLVCGVGALVGVPVAMLFSVFAYRRMIGGPVAQYS
jgi:uncharacterized membrane protein